MLIGLRITTKVIASCPGFPLGGFHAYISIHYYYSITRFLWIAKVGMQFFLQYANPKSANSWVHSAITIRTFLRCDRWPLMTVGKWGVLEYNERGPSLFGSLGLLCRYSRLLSCLGCSSQPRTKYYVPHRTLFHVISLIGHHPAQTVVLGRLFLCLWFQNPEGHPSLVSPYVTNYAKKFLELFSLLLHEEVRRFMLPFQNLILLSVCSLNAIFPAIRWKERKSGQKTE
jgi:hypothetical protein